MPGRRPVPGADFTYLAANVVDKRLNLPLLLPFNIRIVDGVPVGFVGMTLEGTPSIVNPAGIQDVDFSDEIETANKYATLLRLLGVKSMVLLLHEGGSQSGSPQPVDGCDNFAGPIVDIVKGLRPEYGIVVSGHTHRFYSCSLPNSAGNNAWSPAPAPTASWSPTSTTRSTRGRASSPRSPRAT